MWHRHVMAIDRVGVRWRPDRRVQMRNNLMTEQIEIDPLLRRPPFGTAQHIAIEMPGISQIVNRESQMERARDSHGVTVATVASIANPRNSAGPMLMHRPALSCLILGALAAGGFAPAYLWPLTLLAVAGWLAMIHAAQTWRTALWRGWLFGWAHLTLANMWIAQAFVYQDAMPRWLGIPGVMLSGAYLALYPMLTAGITWRLGRARMQPDLAFVLVAGAAWIGTEWLRATLLTGYPWPPLATIWLPVLGVAGSAAWIGTYALSGVTVVLAGTVTLLARRQWWPAAVAAVCLAPLAISGIKSPATPIPAPIDHPRIRVVQPDLDQEQRPRDDYPESNLRAVSALSGTPGPAPRLIVWPEGALRYFIEDGYPQDYYPRGGPAQIRRRIAGLLGPDDVVLTGGSAIQFRPDGSIASATNSVFAIDAKARILGRYDKSHLVPFGEYLPLRPILSRLGLERLVPGDIDFAPGVGPRDMVLPQFGPVGMLICYEVIFSGRIIDPVHRPSLIFNPSNDSWYAQYGPEQHLAQARLRAIEEGLPLIRATPTGISAIVAADGRIIDRVPWEKAGAIEAAIPPPLPPTLFARLGNWMALIVALVLVALAVAIRRVAR